MDQSLYNPDEIELGFSNNTSIRQKSTPRDYILRSKQEASTSDHQNRRFYNDPYIWVNCIIGQIWSLHFMMIPHLLHCQIHPTAVINHCINQINWILSLDRDSFSRNNNFNFNNSTIISDQIFLRILIAIVIHYDLPIQKVSNIRKLLSNFSKFKENPITLGRCNQDLFSSQFDGYHTKATIRWKNAIHLIRKRIRLNNQAKQNKQDLQELKLDADETPKRPQNKASTLPRSHTTTTNFKSSTNQASNENINSTPVTLESSKNQKSKSSTSLDQSYSETNPTRQSESSVYDMPPENVTTQTTSDPLADNPLLESDPLNQNLQNKPSQSSSNSEKYSPTNTLDKRNNLINETDNRKSGYNTPTRKSKEPQNLAENIVESLSMNFKNLSSLSNTFSPKVSKQAEKLMDKISQQTPDHIKQYAKQGLDQVNTYAELYKQDFKNVYNANLPSSQSGFSETPTATDGTNTPNTRGSGLQQTQSMGNIDSRSLSKDYEIEASQARQLDRAKNIRNLELQNKLTRRRPNLRSQNSSSLFNSDIDEIDIDFSVCTACPSCGLLCYEEEIMGSWTYSDLNSLIVCRGCKKRFDAILHVVLKIREKKVGGKYKNLIPLISELPYFLLFFYKIFFYLRRITLGKRKFFYIA